MSAFLCANICTHTTWTDSALIQRVALILKYHDAVQLPLPCPLGLEYER